ncbi:hypothetical protein ACFLQ7_01515 [Actinomycetota bacterium]
MIAREVPVVLTNEGDYERDFAASKAMWDFEAAPAVLGLLAAFALLGVWKVWKSVQRLAGRHGEVVSPPSM